MEANKIYRDIVYLTYNIFKNEKTRSNIVLEPEFEDKLLIIINDILLLEKDYDMKLQDRTWFSEFGKTIVNIVQKKLKFEKEDNKKLSQVDEDYVEIINYIKNVLKVEQAEIEETDFLLSSDELKKYQTVSADLLDKYRTNVEVINEKDKVFENNSSNNNQQFNSQPGIDPMSAMNPFTNDRFYPYRTKPTKVRLMRIVLFSVLLFAGLAMLLNIVGEFVFSKTVTLEELFSNSVDKATILAGITNHFSSSNAFIFGTGSSFKTSSSYTIIITTGLYIFLIAYIGNKLITRPRNFREYYYTTSWLLYIVLIFFLFTLISNITQNTNSNSLSWGPENVYNSIKSVITNDTDTSRVFTSEIIKKYFVEGGSDLTSVHDYIVNNVFNSDFKSKYNVFLAFTIIFYIAAGALIATVIFAIVYNPKMDREKISRLQMEIQRQVAMAMQGQKYEIDSTLFTPQDEYDEIMNKIKSKENNKKKDQPDN